MSMFVKRVGVRDTQSLHGLPFSEELKRMPDQVRVIVIISFDLRYLLRTSEVEEAGLKLDTSLGFTRQWSLRNSYRRTTVHAL